VWAMRMCAHALRSLVQTVGATSLSRLPLTPIPTQAPRAAQRGTPLGNITCAQAASRAIWSQRALRLLRPNFRRGAHRRVVLRRSRVVLPTNPLGIAASLGPNSLGPLQGWAKSSCGGRTHVANWVVVSTRGYCLSSHTAPFPSPNPNPNPVAPIPCIMDTVGRRECATSQSPSTDSRVTPLSSTSHAELRIPSQLAERPSSSTTRATGMPQNAPALLLYDPCCMPPQCVRATGGPTSAHATADTAATG
jgi:hypothetical protein